MEYKPEFEDLEPYYRAFWQGEVLDRVAVAITAPRDSTPLSIPNCPNWNEPKVVLNEKPERILDYFEATCKNTFYGGLAVPFFWPNSGPDVFSAFLGTDLKLSEDSKGTSWVRWSEVISDYQGVSHLEIKDDNPFYRKVLDLTRYAVERGKGKYLVGLTDLHGGFDALSVLRGGPEKASLDLIENPEGVKSAMHKLYQAWQKIYDDSYRIIKDNQPGTICWISIWAPGKMYSVQSDFSCLVSAKMYRELLLEELLSEINYLDYSIYHLDGVEALQHLDLLLEIPKLNAIQWVSGARFEKAGIEKWLPLYQKIQAKKKSIVVYPSVKEIPLVLENLKPEGLLIQTHCSNEAEARDILAKLGWR
ncbi:MAG: hypothetical protein V2A65_06860 [Candidatus Omnitrophota bacterium]